MKHLYKDLWHVARKYYNETNCCSVIAVASLCDISFGKARKIMEKHGRKHRKGSWAFLDVIVKRGYKFIPVTEYDGTFVKKLGDRLPSGNYCIITAQHVLAMHDGVVNDHSADTARRIKRMWKVEKCSDGEVAEVPPIGYYHSEKERFQKLMARRLA